MTMIKSRILCVFKNLFLSKKGKKILTAVSVLVGLFVIVKIAISRPYLSEYLFARGISRFFASVLQPINALIPFSVFETLLVLLVFTALCALVSVFILNFNVTEKGALNFLYGFCTVMTAVVLFYNVTATAMFKRQSVAVALGLDVNDPSQEDMLAAANWYLDGLIELDGVVQRQENGDSILAYDFSKYNDLLKKEYAKLDGNDYFNKYSIRLKKVLLSVPMTYTGITGAYVGILGEGSINVNVPNYTLPVTMAHEMAHGKGVMRENEANFTAYYICINSDDVYLKYSGYMFAFNACYGKLTKEQRVSVYDRIPQTVLKEYTNTNEFYDNYQGIVERIMNFINDTNLKSAGLKEGVISYSLTDKFLVALYKKKIGE